MSEVNRDADGSANGSAAVTGGEDTARGRAGGGPGRAGRDRGGRADSAAGSRQTRIGAWSRVTTARPWFTLAFALIFVVLAVVAGSGAPDRLRSGGYQAPDAQSTVASEELDRYFPGARPNLLLMVSAKAGVDDPAAARAGRELAARLEREKSVVGVVSYWDTKAPGLRAKDGRQALIAARITGENDQATKVLDRLAPEYRGTHGPVEVSVGGPLAVQHDMQRTIQEDLIKAEAIALPITLVLLVVVFGSAVAALLPLGIGLVAIVGTNAVLGILTLFTDVSVFALNLTTALGLGLAIDYALFIVRRFREELPGAPGPREAVAVTLRTAGRTVLFSALTVAVSLSAMLVFPQYFLRSFAYAGIAVVLLAAAAALVVLPAVLVLLGHRVNALDLRRLLPARRRRQAAVDGGGRAGRTPDEGWGRLARTVMRHAPFFAIGTTAVLLALGVPFLGVRFGSVDDRQLPSDAESHLVQQDIRERFPGSPGDAIEVLAKGTAATSGQEMADYARRLSELPGVVRVESPAGTFTEGGLSLPPGPADAQRIAPQGGIAYLTVLPKGEAYDSGAQELVREIRAVDAPFEAKVTGAPAVLVDIKDTMGERLPAAAVIIAVTTLALVFLLTGSVLIPLQAVVLNALSLTAMFGAVVWVFQDGHLSGLLGFTATGSIETTLPVLMFCVAFGLSMDYGVFLLSRIKEEYDHTGDHVGAVVFGVQRTGGLITAAAVILAVVLAAIGTSRVSNTKMLGLGVALAVLMDAMVVRGLLVPAVMRLTGKATWWAPRPLRWLHVRIGLSEGEAADRHSGRGTGGRAGSGHDDTPGPGAHREPAPGTAAFGGDTGQEGTSPNGAAPAGAAGPAGPAGAADRPRTPSHG